MESSSEYSIILSTRAEREIQNLWQWYEEKRKGLGDQLMIKIVSKIEKVRQNPELYPLKNKLYRETLTSTFPILIVFKINKVKKVIKINSAFHTSQNPAKKYRR